ncbi:MAG: ABC transporter ATP-binding protein [Lachnospiraceae bacterium]|nr:ABC transporter ATP-binding protein [Lachnospiraceae bacterium]
MKQDAAVFDNVEAGYGNVRILNGLSFRVAEGEVFGVIGPNGCGKTTMLNALSGMIRPSKGMISCFGKELNRLEAYERCRLGIGRTWQIPRPFAGMSVYENTLAAAVHGAGRKNLLRDRRSGRKESDTALKALEETGLAEKKDMPSGELTLLDRKRLEVARAMASEPRLLLLDEVAAGLTEAETTQITDLVAGLKEKHYTVIWIEHNIETMMKATDRLMCMSEGRNVLTGDPAEVMASETVERLYLGADDE